MYTHAVKLHDSHINLGPPCYLLLCDIDPVYGLVVFRCALAAVLSKDPPTWMD